MTGLIYTAFYIFCGYLIIRFLLPRVRLLPRLWLGACLGVMLMMWMPALAAFARAGTHDVPSRSFLPADEIFPAVRACQSFSGFSAGAPGPSRVGSSRGASARRRV